MPDHVHDQFRFCPRCGADGFSNRVENAYDCPCCSFRYYVNPTLAGGAVLVAADGRILLTRRSIDPGKGLLGLPGGFINAYETAEDGVRREIREETNLEVGELSYLTSHPNPYRSSEGIYPVLDIFFFAHILSMDSIRLSAESDAWLLMKPSEVRMEEIAFPSLRMALKSYFERIL